MPSPLRIGYLLEDTDLSGGVRVQLAQADALIGRGHQVTMFTKGMPLHWRRSRAEWQYIDDFSQVNAGELDFLIGGFWTTVEPAYQLAGDRAIHLCQGYEATFTAYQSIRPQIEATYQLPVPKITVSRHLVPLLEKYGFKAVWVGQIVDAEFFRPAIPAENEPLRVLLAGASQVDVKGISDGYGAVAHARSYGARFDLIRVSPWAPAHDEPVEELVQEFHAGLNTESMVRLIQSCDVFLGPNRAEEGFGLPAAESLASGLPAVLTRIPSYISWAETLDFALFAEEGDAEALGDQLLEMIQNEDLREELRPRGREVAEQFRAENAADRLENFLLARRAGLAQNRPTERESSVGNPQGSDS